MSSHGANAYYPWFVRDYRSSRKVQRMGWQARGFYRELLDEEFLEGSLPTDIASLADICGCPVKVLERVWPEIAPCFQEIDAGRLVNAKLEEIRTEKDRIRVKRAESGRLGGIAKQKVANAKHVPYSKAEQSRAMQSAATPKAEPLSFVLPVWVPEQTWRDFEEMRKKLRKPMTDRARRDIVGKLDRLRQAGEDPEAVLGQSIRKAWQDVFEVKDGMLPAAAKPDPLARMKFANVAGGKFK